MLRAAQELATHELAARVGSVHIKGGGEGSTEKPDYSCHAQSELSDKWIV